MRSVPDSWTPPAARRFSPVSSRIGEPFTRDRHHDYRRRGSIAVVRRSVVIKRGFVLLTITMRPPTICLPIRVLAERREITLRAPRLTLHAYSCKGPERIFNGSRR
jgi:hypothetical protein